MDWLDPIRDLYQPLQAKRLSARLPAVHLQIEYIEPARGNAYYPAPKFIAEITVDGQSVGRTDYAINPLRDRLYINKIEIHPEFKRRGYALAVLWQLHCENALPIVPVAIYSTNEAHGFWNNARLRLKAAGADIEGELRTAELLQEQLRWQHLVPELPHERQIRELMASPEWPEIEAGFKARQTL
ncbi:N-acetyltransferase [Pseudomonas rubra]|uniref:N-acetyltransferase n=1 Tax=Pseudomonas rubra TaxID=2942627 RepID=A0ABT5PFB5_9PSED|nr:N-acetyltransferase [Pseudomonas rubra]MDD1016958.1 N-acetyltransferase [Pseudomonas rubra]MDD1041045.1 N-acetyltransferase [Pseudomonas rubra]MDD1157472.1 N-acetyltransferase [Pseudomonas rubra]